MGASHKAISGNSVSSTQDVTLLMRPFLAMRRGEDEPTAGNM
jgi:hypothetical protein